MVHGSLNYPSGAKGFWNETS